MPSIFPLFSCRISADMPLRTSSRSRRVLDAVLSENHRREGARQAIRWRAPQSWRDDVRNGMQALILQNKGKIEGIWASFDGQAYVIDDLLRDAGLQEGRRQAGLGRWRRGDLSPHRRSASTVLATVAIPFEAMGKARRWRPSTRSWSRRSRRHGRRAGPYLYMDAVLVEAANVAQFNK